MNVWAYAAIRDTVAFCTGAYLVVNDSPWWAALCFLTVVTTTVKSEKKA